MKKFIHVFLPCFFLAILCHAELRSRVTGYYLVDNYGDRNSVTINNLISGIGTNREAVCVFDNGPWSIYSDVTFPSNVAVVVIPGSYFNIDTNVTMTFQNNELIAGFHKVFDGDGTATGEASFIYRTSDWGNTNQYDVGDGAIGYLTTNIIGQVEDLLDTHEDTQHTSTGTYDRVTVDGFAGYADTEDMTLDETSFVSLKYLSEQLTLYDLEELSTNVNHSIVFEAVGAIHEDIPPETITPLEISSSNVIVDYESAWSTNVYTVSSNYNDSLGYLTARLKVLGGYKREQYKNDVLVNFYVTTDEEVEYSSDQIAIDLWDDGWRQIQSITNEAIGPFSTGDSIYLKVYYIESGTGYTVTNRDFSLNTTLKFTE